MTIANMDAVATHGTIANLDINSANPTKFPLVVCRRFNKEGLLLNDSNDSSSVRITPHYESIKTGDETSVSPIYTPEIMKSAPWEVSIAFFPNYLPRINLDLEGLLYVDMEKIEGAAESSGRESAVGPSIISLTSKLRGT